MLLFPVWHQTKLWFMESPDEWLCFYTADANADAWQSAAGGLKCHICLSKASMHTIVWEMKYNICVKWDTVLFSTVLPFIPSFFLHLLFLLQPQSGPSPPGSCLFLRTGSNLAVFVSTGWRGAQAPPHWGTSHCKSKSCPTETGEHTPAISLTTWPPGQWRGTDLQSWCRCIDFKN